jgi:integrase
MDEYYKTKLSIDQHNTELANFAISLVKRMGGMHAGSILCQKCVRARVNRVCINCGHDACFIRISYLGEKISIFHDRHGRTHSFHTAYQDLLLINAELAEKRFDPTRWVKAEVEQRKFQYQYGEWLVQKEKEAKQGTFSYATLRLYRSYCDHHYKKLRDLDIREIRLKNLQEVLNSWPDTLSLKYRLNMMLAIRTFMKWTVRWGTLEKLPPFPEIRMDGGRPSRAISYEEQMAAIDKEELKEHRDILLFMRETALRISEVCAVKVKDIDVQNRRMLVQRTFSERQVVERTKSRKKDWLPLTPDSCDIADRLTNGRFGEEFLFLNPLSNQVYMPDFLRKIWRTHSGTKVTLYEAMRHSTISDWSRRGANAYVIRDGARHADIRTSNRYVHNALNDVRDMMSRKNVVKIKTRSETGEGKSKKPS